MVQEIKEIEKYDISSDDVTGKVRIYESKKAYVPVYELTMLELEPATKAILDSMRERLIQEVKVKVSEILDPKAMGEIKKRFMERALKVMSLEFTQLSEQQQKYLAGILVHEMLGLGKLELLINDAQLEEIVINKSTEPVWVYHKKQGWLVTNIKLPNEEQIYNYASVIGRKVGRQITNLNPLMDAHLLTGDRVNATLFPISSSGNTITIRKFARDPWTITHFISPEYNTLNKEMAALIWLCVEYELNVLAAGGTASGKTSMLNALLPFVPSNHRIISIEDTRELQLPKFLHWIPLTTREANPEGKGEITMLDLMVNSLRMRPDRIVLGEIRRQREAEVLFEAMHTGHSVYSTLHADTANQVKIRLINPPIDLPEQLLEALHLVVVQFRHRRLNIRRTLEVAEVIPAKGPHPTISMNVLYRWKPKGDRFEPVKESVRLSSEIELHTGMSEKEIKEDLTDKQMVLEWMLKKGIKTTNTVGKVVADYYKDSQYVIDIAQKGKSPSVLLTEDLLKELVK